MSEIDSTIARKKAKSFLTNKYFPSELRAILWSKLVANPTSICEKWYQSYLKILSNRQKLGSYDLIEKKVTEALDEMELPYTSNNK